MVKSNTSSPRGGLYEHLFITEEEIVVGLRYTPLNSKRTGLKAVPSGAAFPIERER
jgi:hypothetical protein